MIKQRVYPVAFGASQDTLFSVMEIPQGAIWLTKAGLPAATTFPSDSFGLATGL